MKILLLGSTGFVGRNVFEVLSGHLPVVGTSRAPLNSSFLQFDVSDRKTWKNIADFRPDVIINAVAYGVVKNEVEHEKMFLVNYLGIADFYDFLIGEGQNPFWLQLGTAFEYDLSIEGGISEATPCLPRTNYGISKLMFSNYLFSRAKPGTFAVIRPFGMFGKYEDDSKFFPMLILAQRRKAAISLSSGLQERDYFFVEDLANFIGHLILNDKLKDLPPLLNLGSGKGTSFRQLSEVLSSVIPDFRAEYWKWGEVPMRANESKKFFNDSAVASQLGFEVSDLTNAFRTTVNYYCTRQ